MYEKIQETASWLKERMTTKPETAIILGTGLGQLATEITDSYEFSYSDIPNFPIFYRISVVQQYPLRCQLYPTCSSLQDNDIPLHEKTRK